jgi:DnaT-like ssDNA binding protein
MTIIVENGTVVTGANSYVSAADFTAYALARGVTLTSGAETLLIQAMDYIESLSFIGTKWTRDQSLQWPRLNVHIDGYANDVNHIPQELINAQMQVAMAIDTGNGPLATVARSTKRERVGELEVEYMAGAAATPIVRTINAMLWKLLANGFGFRVTKA